MWGVGCGGGLWVTGLGCRIEGLGKLLAVPLVVAPSSPRPHGAYLLSVLCPFVVFPLVLRPLLRQCQLPGASAADDNEEEEEEEGAGEEEEEEIDAKQSARGGASASHGEL